TSFGESGVEADDSVRAAMLSCSCRTCREGDRRHKAVLSPRFLPVRSWANAPSRVPRLERTVPGVEEEHDRLLRRRWRMATVEESWLHVALLRTADEAAFHRPSRTALFAE